MFDNLDKYLFIQNVQISCMFNQKMDLSCIFDYIELNNDIPYVSLNGNERNFNEFKYPLKFKFKFSNSLYMLIRHKNKQNYSLVKLYVNGSVHILFLKNIDECCNIMNKICNFIAPLGLTLSSFNLSFYHDSLNHKNRENPYNIHDSLKSLFATTILKNIYDKKDPIVIAKELNLSNSLHITIS